MEELRIHYLDASAMVKLFINEESSSRVREYFGKESVFFSTSICFAETLGVLKAMHFYRRTITEEQYLSACEELIELVLDKNIQIEDAALGEQESLREVERIVRKYRIDFSDALQIVSVKVDYFNQFKSECRPILITGDADLAKAAVSEGLRVWNCVQDPPPNEVGAEFARTGA